MARRRAQESDSESGDSDPQHALDEGSENELPQNSSKKKRARRIPSSSSTTREASVDEEANARSESTGPSTTPSDARPLYTSNATLFLDKRENCKVGAPESTPTYTSSSKSNVVANKLDITDLRSAVSATTRLVLARQLNGKPVTGSEICQIALSKLGGTSDKKDFNKFLLGFIRVEVAKRLKNVFGFELFAGQNELALTDKWQIVNALDNDELKRMVGIDAASAEGTQSSQNEDDDDTPGQRDRIKEDTDKERGAVMVVLAIIMQHKNAAVETDLYTDLELFGFSADAASKLKRENSPKMSIPDILSKMTKKGFVEKSKNTSGAFVFKMGPTALNEIGKRNVLLFMSQSCKLQLDEIDEEAFLQLKSKS